jgi:3-oxoacyl-[acyl-carrier protein] reductase
MSKTLNGKVAIVTGGCRGIGKSIVERLASDGARVYALDFKLPGDDEVFIESEDIKSLVSCLQLDVTSFDSVNSAFDTVLKEAGRIDVLVNNAGITRDNLVMRMSEQEWDAVIDTNLKGAFICSKVAIKTMMSQRSGRIINIGSIVGSIGNAGQTNYSASKAGMFGLTKSMAKELGTRNILVNCVAPGYVATHMTDVLNEEQRKKFLENIPLRRPADPKDIANVCAFFAGDDSSYVTGQVIHVDGGLAM